MVQHGLSERFRDVEDQLTDLSVLADSGQISENENSTVLHCLL